LAATPLVPDPQNGSKTSPPSRVEATSARLMSRKGFWVGWYPWSFSRLGTAGIRHTEDTWPVGSGLFTRSWLKVWFLPLLAQRSVPSGAPTQIRTTPDLSFRTIISGVGEGVALETAL
jgi:hypothetical protein